MPEPVDRPVRGSVPESLRSLFWECDPDVVSIDEHRDYVVGRVLSRGTWDEIQTLRGLIGDDAIALSLTETSGRHLSPRQLRLWETLLDLSHDQVTGWISRPDRRIWDGRIR